VSLTLRGRRGTAERRSRRLCDSAADDVELDCRHSDVAATTSLAADHQLVLHIADQRCRVRRPLHPHSLPPRRRPAVCINAVTRIRFREVFGERDSRVGALGGGSQPPPHQLGCLGGLCKLPQWGPGQSRGQKRFRRISKRAEDISWKQFLPREQRWCHKMTSSTVPTA